MKEGSGRGGWQRRLEPGKRGFEWQAPVSGLDAGSSQEPPKETKSKEGFRKMAMDGHRGSVEKRERQLEVGWAARVWP